MRKILLSMLIVTMLIGCSSKPDESALTTAEMYDEERVLEGTLEIYAPSGKNTDYIVDVVDLYNEKFDANLDVKAVDVAPNTPMVQKVSPKLVANEKMPELLFIEDAVAGAVLEKFSDKFHSSEEYGFIERHGDNIYDAKINILKNLTSNDKIIGFPNDWSNAIIYYNDELFQSIGVDLNEVKDWDELIEVGIKLKEETGTPLLFMNMNGEIDLIKHITEQQGVSMFDENGNLNFTNEAVKNAYEIVKRIKEEGLANEGSGAEYTIRGQESGLIIQGAWFASYQGVDYPDDSGKWRIRTLVDYPGIDQSYAPMSGGSSWYVPKNSENALAALQVIEFALTEPEALEIYINHQGLPANVTAFDLDVSKEGNEYYGGQEIMAVMKEASENSIQGYLYPYSNDFVDFISEASNRIVNEGEEMDKVLQETAEEFADKHKIEVND